MLADRLVDADGLQEGGRELAWSGAGPATAVLTGPSLDMRMLSNGEAALSMSLRVDAAPAGPAMLGLGCGPGCGGSVDLGTALRAAAPGQWLTLKVKLSCLREAGADVSRINETFTLGTAGAMRVTLTNVQLNPDPAGAICPPHP